MINLIKSFHQDESGATAIEYGLIAALIGVALVTAMGFLREGLTDVFTGIGDTLSDAGEKIELPADSQ